MSNSIKKKEEERSIKMMSQVVSVSGIVIHGFGRGSKDLGCPTANVGFLDQDQSSTIDSVLNSGIFFGLVHLIHPRINAVKLGIIDQDDEIQESKIDSSKLDSNDDSWIPDPAIRSMVTSFGFNPCYGNRDKSLEVHVLDYNPSNQDFYDSRIKILILGKIRNESKFDSLDQLIAAIESDKESARRGIASLDSNLVSDLEDFLRNQVSDHDQQVKISSLDQIRDYKR